MYSIWLLGTRLIDILGVAPYNLSYWKWNIWKSNYWWEQGFQSKSLPYSSALDCCGSLIFFTSNPPVPPRTITGRVYSMGCVSSWKRKLLLWEVKTCKIHCQKKNSTNQSDTYIKLKSWCTITERSTCNMYRILTRKVSLCVGCNLRFFSGR